MTKTCLIGGGAALAAAAGTTTATTVARQTARRRTDSLPRREPEVNNLSKQLAQLADGVEVADRHLPVELGADEVSQAAAVHVRAHDVPDERARDVEHVLDLGPEGDLVEQAVPVGLRAQEDHVG